MSDFSLADMFSALLPGSAIVVSNDLSIESELENILPSCVVVDLQSSERDNTFMEGDLLRFLRKAMRFDQHRYFIFVDPKILSRVCKAIVNDADDRIFAQGKYSDNENLSSRAIFERSLAHIFAGYRLAEGSCRYAEEVLPWLVAVDGVSTFLWFQGPIPKEVDVEDLRPCGGSTPKDGDFNLFDGQVYWAGTFSYRDSVNAHMCSMRRLTCMIFEPTQSMSEKQRKEMEYVSDQCNGYDMPHTVLNLSEMDDEDWYLGEWHFDFDILVKKISGKSLPNNT